MNFQRWGAVALLLCLAFLGSCAKEISSDSNKPILDPALVGQWRANVQFTTGAFATIKDLEFLYVFNAGGTMTESSNYDVAPPVPPAYGIWKETGPLQYEAKYQFFLTKFPTDLNEITKGSGWLPVGIGILTEKITLSPDSSSYTSTMQYEAYDQGGNILEGGGVATALGKRLTW